MTRKSFRSRSLIGNRRALAHCQSVSRAGHRRPAGCGSTMRMAGGFAQDDYNGAPAIGITLWRTVIETRAERSCSACQPCSSSRAWSPLCGCAIRYDQRGRVARGDWTCGVSAIPRRELESRLARAARFRICRRWGRASFLTHPQWGRGSSRLAAFISRTCRWRSWRNDARHRRRPRCRDRR